MSSLDGMSEDQEQLPVHQLKHKMALALVRVQYLLVVAAHHLTHLLDYTIYLLSLLVLNFHKLILYLLWDISLKLSVKPLYGQDDQLKQIGRASCRERVATTEDKI